MADLSWTDLRRANLGGASLDGADLRGAKMPIGAAFGLPRFGGGRTGDSLNILSR
jgi:uncharacterized protein YjbI with pentapeptide repeats